MVTMKYELTDETTLYDGVHLHRIRALRDFGDVKAGDLGGFVDNGHNLSHDGNCWIYDEAKAMDGSLVTGDAKIMDYAVLRDETKVYKEAIVKDNALLNNKSKVGYNAIISGDSHIWGACEFGRDVEVTGNSYLSDEVKLNDNVYIKNASLIGRMMFDKGIIIGEINKRIELQGDFDMSKFSLKFLVD